MTGTKRLRIAIFSAIALAVLLFTALFSVSFAQWQSESSKTAAVNGEVGLFYQEFEGDDQVVRTANVSIAWGVQYNNYICVSSTGEESAGTVYIKFETSNVTNEAGVFRFSLYRTPTDENGVPSGGKQALDGFDKIEVNAATLNGRYIQIDFGAGAEQYCALDFLIDPINDTVSFTLNAIVTREKPVNGLEVKFDLNGGSSTTPPPQYVTENGKVSRPADPTRNNDWWGWDGGGMDVIYVFGGWFKDRDCTQFWNFDRDTVTEDLVLYAKWHYKHELDGHWYAVINGELMDMSWHHNFYEETGGQFNDEFSVNVILAQSDEIRFFVDGDVPPFTLDWVDGAIEKKASDNFATALKDGIFTLYFKTDSNHTYGVLSTLTSEALKVKFDLNYGENNSFESQVNDDNSVPRPADPTRNNYVFGGWFEDSACTKFWNFNTGKVTADKTLYAKWHLKSDLDGVWYAVVNGELKGMGWHRNVTDDDRYGDEFFVAVDLKPDDELRFFVDGDVPTFICENNGDAVLKNDGENFATSLVDDRIGLYFKASGDHSIGALAAVSVKIVAFDTNGGWFPDDTPYSRYVDVNNAVSAPTDPVKWGNTEIFLGWYKEDGTRWNFDTVITDDMTLYAQWATLDASSLYIRYGDEDNYNNIKFVKLSGDMAATHTIGCTVWLVSGERVYIYNTWNAPTPRNMTSVNGSATDVRSWTADKDGMYTLQFTQYGEDDYALWVADYWEVESVELTAGTYLYIIDNTLNAANRFVKLENGSAVLNDIKSGTQFKIISLASNGAVTLVNISFTGVSESSSESIVQTFTLVDSNDFAEVINSHPNGGEYKEEYKNKIFQVKAEGAYRAIFADGRLSVAPNFYIVTFDADGGSIDGASTVEQYVTVGETATVPSDPTKGTNNDIFLGWYYNEVLWDFDNNVVNADITLTAKWTYVDSSLWIRHGDEFTKVATSIASKTTVEGTVWLETGERVYMYNTYDGSAPRTITSADGLTMTGKKYLVAEKSGMYTLQFTQNGEDDYSLVVADYWTSETVRLAAGKYVYIANPATGVGKFVKFETVGYTESGKEAGIAAILENVAAGTQFKVIEVSADGEVSLGQMSLTGISDSTTDSLIVSGYSLDAFDGKYAEFVTEHVNGGAYDYFGGGAFKERIVNIKSAGTYRVYLDGDRLEVLPATDGNIKSDATASGYYAVGSFSNYEVLAANRLTTTDIEGIYGKTGLDIANGAMYRIAVVEYGSGVVITKYLTISGSETLVLNNGNEITALYYDEWKDEIVNALPDVYRIIVEGDTAPVVTYRTDIFGADISLGITFKKTPSGSGIAGYYADALSTLKIASLTVSNGVDINAVTAGSSFAFTSGKSYRLALIKPTKSLGAISGAVIAGQIASIGSTWSTGIKNDSTEDGWYVFKDIYLAPGDEFKFVINNNWYSLPSDAIGSGLKTTSADSNIFVDTADVYTLKIKVTNGTASVVYGHTPMQTTVTYANKTSLTVGWVDSIVYKDGTTVKTASLNAPSGDGYYQTDLYTLDSKKGSADYIAPGTSFMIYRGSSRVNATIHNGDKFADDIYRVTRSGYNYTINSTRGGTNIEAKVKGKFTIGVSASGDAVSIGFMGGNAALQTAITTGTTANSGWYAVGTFSNWQAFAANKLTATTIEGVYSATLDFIVTNVESPEAFTKYKIVYVPTSGSNFTWYGKNGSTTNGDEYNMDVMSTEFTVDEFTKGTSSMYPTVKSMFRVVFSQYKTISNKSMASKAPRIHFNNSSNNLSGGTSWPGNYMSYIRDDNATSSGVYYYDFKTSTLLTSTYVVVINFESPHSTSNIWKSSDISSSKFSAGYSYFVEANYNDHWDWWDLEWTPTCKRYNGSSYVSY
ncbi:MAG: InlB B-repeat-containing protein [Clostridiales bacterium]|nr:InlB B-repeat-containing protein [Clostridiales bacterium]